jgi:hypothetical protein
MPHLATHSLGQARPLRGSVRAKGAGRGPGYPPLAASVSGVMGPDQIPPVPARRLPFPLGLASSEDPFLQEPEGKLFPEVFHLGMLPVLSVLGLAPHLQVQLGQAPLLLERMKGK